MRTMILIAIAAMLSGVAFSGTLESGHYYTWAIPEPNVPIGSVITGVQVTLHDLTSANEIAGDGYVKIFLVDDPPVNWIPNIGTLEVGSFLRFLSGSGEDRSIELSAITIEDSWAADIFSLPFSLVCPAEDGTDEVLVMNAALMEYNDYAGNSTPSGLLLRTVGGDAELSAVSVTLTIRSYEGEYYKDVQVFSIEVPVDLASVEKWAEAERLRLMREYYQKIQELEALVAERKQGG